MFILLGSDFNPSLRESIPFIIIRSISSCVIFIFSSTSILINAINWSKYSGLLSLNCFKASSNPLSIIGLPGILRLGSVAGASIAASVAAAGVVADSSSNRYFIIVDGVGGYCSLPPNRCFIISYGL